MQTQKGGLPSTTRKSTSKSSKINIGEEKNNQINISNDSSIPAVQNTKKNILQDPLDFNQIMTMKR